jgi:hypothetical protein
VFLSGDFFILYSSSFFFLFLFFTHPLNCFFVMTLVFDKINEVRVFFVCLVAPPSYLYYSL